MCFRQDGIVAVYLILRVLYADTLLCSFSHFSFGHWGSFRLGSRVPFAYPSCLQPFPPLSFCFWEHVLTS